MDFKELAINLAKCECENEVISLLKKVNVWDNMIYWKPFGGNENNFSIVGNQQSAPDAALVEKLINSVDAVLLKECQIRGIDPESSDAPQNLSEALQKFYGIQDGKLSNIDTKKRNAMSYNIILAATGTKQLPNYTIIDKGEGQTPKKMPDTILSLGKSNKLRIPFVQGKFNMGGTGVLQFCGRNNLQLIITKKCPQIDCKGDETKEYWGVTIVRRENPSNGRRSSMYTYLANADGSIMSFIADKLDIIPSSSGKFDPFEYGMFIKLFEYNISGGLKTNILFDLNYRLALLMPSLAHPIRLIECRDYKGNTLESTLSGLNVRLIDDKRDNIEQGFPISLNFHIEGQEFNASIYVFKEDANDQNYRKDEGIIFALNGQTHGSLSKSFFKRDACGNFSYLANSLLIIVDCSNINGRIREDLFMNSRDRLRESDFKRKIEREFEEYLRYHEGLRALQEERRRKSCLKKLDNEKPLVDVLNNIITKSPTLSRLFLSGERLINPSNLPSVKSSISFNGKQHPSYFILKNKPKKGIYTKKAPINHRFRVQFETDVVNDYFCRDNNKGIFMLICNDIQFLDYSINLHNGIATLTVKLPKNIKVGDKIEFKAVVSDDYIKRKFEEVFHVEAEAPQEYEKSHPKAKGFELPIINEVTQVDWEKYKMNKEDALIIKCSGENGVYDFYINVDNTHFLMEIKGLKDELKVKLVKVRYIYSMVLIGLSLINGLQNKNMDNSEEFDLEEYVKEVTKMVSPIILPLIDFMGEFNINDILDMNESLPA